MTWTLGSTWIELDGVEIAQLRNYHQVDLCQNHSEPGMWSTFLKHLEHRHFAFSSGCTKEIGPNMHAVNLDVIQPRPVLLATKTDSWVLVRHQDGTTASKNLVQHQHVIAAPFKVAVVDWNFWRLRMVLRTAMAGGMSWALMLPLSQKRKGLEDAVHLFSDWLDWFYKNISSFKQWFLINYRIK